MKKKLEADLMSIAHRVLQIKNKSDINQLCIETRRLYEKLAILQFVEEHFEGVKPTIGQAEIVEKMKQFFEENHLSASAPKKVKEEIVVEEIVADEVIEEEIVVDEIEEVLEDEIEEELEEDTINETSDEEFINNEFRPAFELDDDNDENEVETPKEKEEAQISFFDLLGGDYRETTFVKVDQSEELSSETNVNVPKVADFQEQEPENFMGESTEDIEPKSISLNDKLSKGINIDLNDRIAFVKHLFGNSDEDFNRVLNQLITYDSFDE
ncbi:MAG: hypothetical protein PHC28_07500, partial [Flavobacterium sp.]|uniref:hypothetical protein n=1 Tax=Flavobacterium sp. TaxID=239 RepID=UPI0026215457